jgi:hypothetical protein
MELKDCTIEQIGALMIYAQTRYELERMAAEHNGTALPVREAVIKEAIEQVLNSSKVNNLLAGLVKKYGELNLEAEKLDRAVEAAEGDMIEFMSTLSGRMAVGRVP